jgi:hypothetical protein
MSGENYYQSKFENFFSYSAPESAILSNQVSTQDGLMDTSTPLYGALWVESRAKTPKSAKKCQNYGV